MANFEYYLELYSNNKRMLYRTSYEAAYRDLMAEYNEDVRVQNLLAKMAVSDKKSNAALRKALMNDPASFSELTSFLKMKNDRENNSEKAQAKAEGVVKEEYIYPDGIAVQTTDLIRLVDKGKFATFKTQWDNKISAEYISLTPQQQEQFAVDFVEAINNKFWDGAGRTEIMSEIFTKPPTLTREFLRTEQELRTDKARKDAALFPSKLERKQEAKALATFPELEQYDLTGDSSTDGQKKSIFEAAKIKPPSEQDILARAAEYYEPTGSKKFKKGMEEIAVEREAKAAAGKKAKQEMVASLPEWGGQVLKVAPKMEKFAGDDDNTLLDSTDTGVRLGVQTYNSGQFEDVGTALAHINSQDTDDLQKQAAIASYMSRHLREYRTKQNDSLEKLLGEE